MPPFLAAEPQFRLIEGSQSADPLLRAVAPVAWDSDRVRRLKREALRRGNRPNTLCLGRLEANAFQEFLTTRRGIPPTDQIEGLVYDGLEIRVLSEIETVLQVIEVMVHTTSAPPRLPPRDPLSPWVA